uniref:Uncharacterized protein n=1 Tax=Rhizophora mucronata TaxID=61149 RepID=A0A2P2NVE0_RHIMU
MVLTEAARRFIRLFSIFLWGLLLGSFYHYF